MATTNAMFGLTAWRCAQWALETMCTSERPTTGGGRGSQQGHVGLHRLAENTLRLTLLPECEQAEATEVCVTFETRAALLKSPYEDMVNVVYPETEGSSPAGAADNIADK